MDTVSWDAVEQRLNSLTSPDSVMGLVFLKQVMDRLGNPEDFPAIHVAGTNGKGSTCASLESMLRHGGYRTALFTSPHLEVIGERLTINGKMLSPERWMDALDRVEAVLKTMPEAKMGYFQNLTAACYLMIKEEKVDAAVIEVGLGGTSDPSNVLTNPLISVITPLGMDHMHLLGTTIESIGENKFGIVKPGRRAIFCGSPDLLNSRFRAVCADIGAQGEVWSETCSVKTLSSSLKGSRIELTTPCGTEEYFVRLPGAYQPENAGLALRTLELISDRLPLSLEAKRAGLAGVFWPGRMEVMGESPDLILDGAHNPHGTAALIRSLLSLYGADRTVSLVYTSMADKDYASSLKLYAESLPHARLICTEVPRTPRCEKAGQLAQKAAEAGWRKAPILEPDCCRAVRRALDLGDPVIVCGSLYFIGLMREKLLRHEL